MANYFHDEQVTWQKMHDQWTNQQNKMRLKYVDTYHLYVKYLQKYIFCLIYTQSENRR